MPWDNRIVVASAGSGKTTTIIDEAFAHDNGRSALITYTNNNKAELQEKAYERLGHIPPNILVSTWYAFLLRHFVRPYQTHIYPHRIAELQFVNGQSARFAREIDVKTHYFAAPGRIYIDKVSKFACKVIDETGGLPLRRFEQIFGRLYIDESQDLAGYDLDLVEHLMKSATQVILVGDLRQATFATNNSRYNKQYAGTNIIDKFEAWSKSRMATLDYQNHSYRCVQAICDFADQFYPKLPKTVSKNKVVTGHDGVFAVRETDVETYMKRFGPQPLRYDRKAKNLPGRPINFGESKGMTFERTLIFPHKMFGKFLQTGRLQDAGKEVAKIYVAITRARQSTAFVIADGVTPANLPLFKA
jgi:DNA helicase-2/ATP-dependent DNA helicase PcrA